MQSITVFEVSRVRALRGPNLWSRNTAIEAIISCQGDLYGGPGYFARLRQRFPEIGYQSPAGSNESRPIPNTLELAALGLQAQAGCPVSFSRTVQTVEPGIYQVIVEYSEEAVGRMAFDYAQALCLAALRDQPFDLAQALAALRDLNEDVRLGPSTGAIVRAAVARGIPYRRLTEGSLVQFGWGSRQRRIQAAETDRSSAIAEAIAQDKELTKTLLHAAGVPVPEGRPVTSFEDACTVAAELGWPLVVKPRDGNRGKGVTVNIATEDHLLLAYNAAREISFAVMVERYLPGYDYRLLVIGDKLVAAARRDPPHVIGDGIHTIRDLVDQLNSDPRRSDGPRDRWFVYRAPLLSEEVCVVVWVWSTLLTLRQQARRRSKLAQIDASLRKKPANQPELIERRIGKWLGRNTAAEKLFDVEVLVEQQQAVGLRIREDPGKLPWAQAAHGAYLLRTNCTEKDPRKLWRRPSV